MGALSGTGISIFGKGVGFGLITGATANIAGQIAGGASLDEIDPIAVFLSAMLAAFTNGVSQAANPNATIGQSLGYGVISTMCDLAVQAVVKTYGGNLTKIKPVIE